MYYRQFYTEHLCFSITKPNRILAFTQSSPLKVLHLLFFISRGSLLSCGWKCRFFLCVTYVINSFWTQEISAEKAASAQGLFISSLLMKIMVYDQELQNSLQIAYTKSEIVIGIVLHFIEETMSDSLTK